MKKNIPSTSGRDRNGRFTKGNPGGPGNPFARKVSAMRRAMLNAVTEDDLREIVQTLATKAKEGDTAAIKILLDRVIGKPAPALDPDRLELEELLLARLVRQATPSEFELSLGDL